MMTTGTSECNTTNVYCKDVVSISETMRIDSTTHTFDRRREAWYRFSVLCLQRTCKYTGISWRFHLMYLNAVLPSDGFTTS